jgi:enoyl-CoA hydratase/carnithine racemase
MRKGMNMSDVIYQKSGPLAIISLNRVDKKNAFSGAMLDSLLSTLEDAGGDLKIKIIILRGEGNTFCAGGDIMEMAEGKLTSWTMKNYLWEQVQRVPLLIENIDKPVIASIDGSAYGAGFDLALACDIRIASERATFCAAYVRLGLAPGDGGAYFLPRIVGLSKALDILLTGRVISMKEAQALGLIDVLVPADALREKTEQYALDIAQWPLAALRAIKRAVYQGLKSDLKTHLDYISSQLALLSETREHLEAVKRLARKP